MYEAKNHTYVVCAYKDSPYLNECLDSLYCQTIKSNIVIVTSTPSGYLSDIATKYACPLLVRTGESNIADDWNFGISIAQTPLVTIAHQDDVYSRDYTEQMLSSVNSVENSFLIYFSNYGEIRDGQKIHDSKLLNMKKLLLRPLLIRRFCDSVFVKRSVLALGNPICCPSVTFNLDRLPRPVFKKGFRSNLDWDAWERFSRLKGSFVYNDRTCIYHRVHRDSETSACIIDDTRSKEDLSMLTRFWPEPIAKVINLAYKRAQANN